MSGTALEKVRSEALNLPEAERAELAYNLVVSLDGPPDSDAEKAWVRGDHAQTFRDRLGHRKIGRP